MRHLSYAVIMTAGLLAATPSPSSAQTPADYPHKVVTLVTHSSPGGGSDVFLRSMIKYLPKYINATFIIDNVQGGSGARALSRLALAPPDGSTFYATTPTYIYTSLLSKPQHGFRDVEPLVNFFTDSEVAYTRADGPFKTLADVIEKAKTARGRWGSANPASLERQAAEQLKRAAKVNAAVVSHEGGGDLMINVLNGTLDIGIGEIAELRPQIEAGKIRLLATFDPKRMEAAPDLPTVRELGYDVALEKFRGLAGPKGLPPAITKIWDEAVPKILADPEYQKVFKGESLVPNFIPHAQYQGFIQNFGASTENFLKETGVLK